MASAIRSQVNARDLQIECARALHEASLVPVLMYGSETMLWKERTKIGSMQPLKVCWLSGEWIKSCMHG